MSGTPSSTLDKIRIVVKTKVIGGGAALLSHNPLEELSDEEELKEDSAWRRTKPHKWIPIPLEELLPRQTFDENQNVSSSTKGADEPVPDAAALLEEADQASEVAVEAAWWCRKCLNHGERVSLAALQPGGLGHGGRLCPHRTCTCAGCFTGGGALQQEDDDLGLESLRDALQRELAQIDLETPVSFAVSTSPTDNKSPSGEAEQSRPSPPPSTRSSSRRSSESLSVGKRRRSSSSSSRSRKRRKRSPSSSRKRRHHEEGCRRRSDTSLLQRVHRMQRQSPPGRRSHCNKCSNHGVMVAYSKQHRFECAYMTCCCGFCLWSTLRARASRSSERRAVDALMEDEEAVEAALQQGEEDARFSRNKWCCYCRNHGRRVAFGFEHVDECRWLRSCCCPPCLRETLRLQSMADCRNDLLCFFCRLHGARVMTDSDHICPYRYCRCDKCDLVDGKEKSQPRYTDDHLLPLSKFAKEDDLLSPKEEPTLLISPKEEPMLKPHLLSTKRDPWIRAHLLSPKEEPSSRAHLLSPKEDPLSRAHLLSPKEDPLSRAHLLSPKEDPSSRAHLLSPKGDQLRETHLISPRKDPRLRKAHVLSPKKEPLCNAHQKSPKEDPRLRKVYLLSSKEEPLPKAILQSPKEDTLRKTHLLSPKEDTPRKTHLLSPKEDTLLKTHLLSPKQDPPRKTHLLSPKQDPPRKTHLLSPKEDPPRKTHLLSPKQDPPRKTHLLSPKEKPLCKAHLLSPKEYALRKVRLLSPMEYRQRKAHLLSPNEDPLRKADLLSPNEDPLRKADLLSTNEDPLRKADLLSPNEDPLRKADLLSTNEDPLRKADLLSPNEDPLRKADLLSPNEDPLRKADLLREVAPQRDCLRQDLGKDETPVEDLQPSEVANREAHTVLRQSFFEDSDERLSPVPPPRQPRVQLPVLTRSQSEDYSVSPMVICESDDELPSVIDIPVASTPVPSGARQMEESVDAISEFLQRSDSSIVTIAFKQFDPMDNPLDDSDLKALLEDLDEMESPPASPLPLQPPLPTGAPPQPPSAPAPPPGSPPLPASDSPAIRDGVSPAPCPPAATVTAVQTPKPSVSPCPPAVKLRALPSPKAAALPCPPPAKLTAVQTPKPAVPPCPPAVKLTALRTPKAVAVPCPPAPEPPALQTPCPPAVHIAGSPTSTDSRKVKKLCKLCRNHGVEVVWTRKHRWECVHRACDCEACLTVKKQWRSVLEYQHLNREMRRPDRKEHLSRRRFQVDTSLNDSDTRETSSFDTSSENCVESGSKDGGEESARFEDDDDATASTASTEVAPDNFHPDDVIDDLDDSLSDKLVIDLEAEPSRECSSERTEEGALQTERPEAGADSQDVLDAAIEDTLKDIPEDVPQEPPKRGRKRKPGGRGQRAAGRPRGRPRKQPPPQQQQQAEDVEAGSKIRYCGYCRHHGVLRRLRGHKALCPYRFSCVCRKCVRRAGVQEWGPAWDHAWGQARFGPSSPREEATTLSPREEDTTLSPREEATTLPPREEATTLSPREEDTTLSPREEATTLPPREEATTLSPREEAPVTLAPQEETPVTLSPREEAPAALSPQKEATTLSPREEASTTLSPRQEASATVSPREEVPATSSPPREEASTCLSPPKEATTLSPREEAPTTSSPTKEAAILSPREEASITLPPQKESTTASSPQESAPALLPQEEAPVTLSPQKESTAILALQEEAPATPSHRSPPKATVASPSPRPAPPASLPETVAPSGITTPPPSGSASLPPLLTPPTLSSPSTPRASGFLSPPFLIPFNGQDCIASPGGTSGGAPLLTSASAWSPLPRAAPLSYRGGCTPEVTMPVAVPLRSNTWMSPPALMPLPLVLSMKAKKARDASAKGPQAAVSTPTRLTHLSTRGTAPAAGEKRPHLSAALSPRSTSSSAQSMKYVSKSATPPTVSSTPLSCVEAQKYCSDCGLSVASLKELAMHRAAHHMADTRQVCHQCGSVSWSKLQSDVHTALAHPVVIQDNLRCPACAAFFPSELLLNTHLLITNDETHHRTQIQAQAMVYSGTMSFKCNLCRSTFSSPMNLAQHVTVKHPNETPYMCDEPKCNLAFDSPLVLLSHRQLHRQDNPQHRCKACARAFVNREVLLSHRLLHHTGSHPFVCPPCNRGFWKNDGLIAHVRRAHPGMKLYPCQEEGCRLNFEDPGSLFNHACESLHMAPNWTSPLQTKCNEPDCSAVFSETWSCQDHQDVEHMGLLPLARMAQLMSLAKEVRLHVRK